MKNNAIYAEMMKDPVIGEMVRQYGEKFPGLEHLFATELTPEDFKQLDSPTPDTGRYLGSVVQFQDTTSAKNIGLLRLQIIVKYLIALSEFLNKNNDGNRPAVVPWLNQSQVKRLEKIGQFPVEVKMAELIERCTNHDTAAAGELVKLLIGKDIPDLRSYVEAVHFACTSEDVMGNVFGLIGNRVVYGMLVPRLIDYLRFLMKYCETYEANGPLILPAFTHEQAAEPTTLGKKWAVTIRAIIYLLEKLQVAKGGFQPFSGKMGSAVGNLAAHFSAYPNANWWKFSNNFVSDLGLHYESMTHQSVSYAVEVQIFSTLINVINQIMKITDDFIKMARCPAQFFVKKKKKGEKGSSIMPGKSNAWACEGALKMLTKARALLRNLVDELPNYPDEGNMGRSYLMRDMGSAFMPIFIALDRITREMNSYQPNHANIKAVLDRYPGMCGSSLQTVLKRLNFEGDAYRAIQGISINDDGSYANADEFRTGLIKVLNEMGIDEVTKVELLETIKFNNMVAPVHAKVQLEFSLNYGWLDAFGHMVKSYVPATFTEDMLTR